MFSTFVSVALSLSLSALSLSLHLPLPTRTLTSHMLVCVCLYVAWQCVAPLYSSFVFSIFFSLLFFSSSIFIFIYLSRCLVKMHLLSWVCRKKNVNRTISRHCMHALCSVSVLNWVYCICICVLIVERNVRYSQAKTSTRTTERPNDQTKWIGFHWNLIRKS